MLSRNQYVAIETLISVAINAALSIGFVFLVFHGRSQVAAAGRHGIVPDMAPQTFMVVLMSCLVPALLTRRRMLTRALPWNAMRSKVGISEICFTAVIAAALSTAVVVALCWLALPRLLPTGVSFLPLLIGKALFGMFLASLATPWALAKVLR